MPAHPNTRLAPVGDRGKGLGKGFGPFGAYYADPDLSLASCLCSLAAFLSFLLAFASATFPIRVTSFVSGSVMPVLPYGVGLTRKLRTVTLSGTDIKPTIRHRKMTKAEWEPVNTATSPYICGVPRIGSGWFRPDGTGSPLRRPSSSCRGASCTPCPSRPHRSRTPYDG